MPKAEYTDTQRMDWLASKGTLEVEDIYLGPVNIEQSGDRLCSGTDLRAAIDNGMRKARIKPLGVTACPHGVPHRWSCEKCDATGVEGRKS